MKSRIITIFFLVIINLLNAQSTTILYERRPNVEYQLRNETRLKVKERVSKHLLANIKNYELLNSNGKSLYKEQVTDTVAAKSQLVYIASKNIYYKNYNKNLYLRETAIQSKNYLIKDSLPKYNWKITKDYKDILGYECQKAITTVNEEIIEAWISYKLPINDGPIDYWIEDAVILELNTNNFKIIAKNISTSSKDVSIEKPNNGEITNRQSFSEKINAYKANLFFHQIKRS